MAIYFDNAATTPLSNEVFEAMKPYFLENFGNPSSTHSLGRKTRAAIEKSRKTIAKILNVSPGEIFFTSGGTESNNFAINNAVRKFGVERIITSKLEHHCVLHTIGHYSCMKNTEIQYVNLLDDGHIDLAHLQHLCQQNSKKTLVSLMHANNEIGNLLDLEAVSNICSQNNCLFHTDTVQTFGHYPIDLQQVKVHFLSGSAHKFHGPKGIGILYCNPELKSEPLLFGGAQERNMRAGTENLYGIVGIGKAAELAYENLEEERTKITELKNYFKNQIQEKLPEITFNGDCTGNALYTVLNINFSKYAKSSLLSINLDVEGICVSGGSACSSGSNKGSHVLSAIKNENEENKNSLRFSFSKYNTKDEVDKAISVLTKLLVQKQEMVA